LKDEKDEILAKLASIPDGSAARDEMVEKLDSLQDEIDGNGDVG